MFSTYIVAAKRTAIASFLGSLKDLSAVSLQAAVIKQCLKETGVDAAMIEEVIIGNVLQANLGQGPARQASIHAGLPDTVPAYAINMVCGSGMKSIITAETEIAAGRRNILIAGGMEHMSSAPFLVPATIRSGCKFGDLPLVDSLQNDALIDAFHHYHMGITAENIAERYHISREDQDVYAYNSQQKAIDAIDNGRFTKEIIDIEVTINRKNLIFNIDEYPNRTSTPEKLASLRPAFKKGGSITAGNASGINDGASAVILLSDKVLAETTLNPMARIIASTAVGVDPTFMGMGPLNACTALIEKSGIGIKDIGLIELNEAFASQSLAVIRELARIYNIPPEEIIEKTNVNGGAIALGHPVGCSGNRIVVTLLHAMQNLKVHYGMAALCIGGGMGLAMLFERQ